LEKILCRYIKYKFIFDKNIKHSSYLYQKIFRSIYGYHQNVTKKNNKVYKYFREGVLSNIPYIRPGKNSVILPINYEHKLINFFQTGENPTHKWRTKGNWKVDYNIKDIEIDVKSIADSLENYINNYKIINVDNTKLSNIYEELSNIVDNNINNIKYKLFIYKKLKNIVKSQWFEKSKRYSELLNNLYVKYKLLESQLNNIL
jgi:hypothetical protein